MVKMFAEGTVLSRLRLALLLLKMRKKISAPRACAARMAGSTKIALPISESSTNKSLRGVPAGPANKALSQSSSMTKGVASAQSGTPTRWSIVRMVSTLRLISRGS